MKRRLAMVPPRRRIALSIARGSLSCAALSWRESPRAYGRWIFSRAACLLSERTMYQARPCVGLLEHDVARAGVVVPAISGRKVHGADFHCRSGSLMRAWNVLLLLGADFEPDLDQHDAAVDDVFSNSGKPKKSGAPPRAEPHHVFDAGAVIPLRSKITISPGGECWG